MILWMKTMNFLIKNWPYVPDHLYRVLIIVGSGSIKTNALINLMKEQDIDNPIDKIQLNV